MDPKHDRTQFVLCVVVKVEWSEHIEIETVLYEFDAKVVTEEMHHRWLSAGIAPLGAVVCSLPRSRHHGLRRFPPQLTDCLVDVLQ